MLVVLALSAAWMRAPASVEARSLSLSSVTQALNAYPGPELGGQYAADLLGYYRDAGLSDRIVPFDPRQDVATMVDRGDVGFGMLPADALLAARARGLHLVAVMNTFQISPQGLLWHSAAGIHSLADLAGRTVIGAGDAYWWRYLERHYHLGAADVHDEARGLAAFLRLPESLLACSITNEPYAAHQMGAAVQWALVAQSGYDPYPQLLVTSETMIHTHPDTVRAFVAANLRGWRRYLDDPRQTLALLESYPGAEHHPLTPDAMLFGFLQIRPLVVGGDAQRDGLGAMSGSRFDVLASQLTSLGILHGASDPRAAFTLAFLPR